MNSRVEGHRRQGVDVELVPHGIAVPHQGLDVEQGLLLASGSLLEGDDRELVIQLSGHDAMDVGKLLNLKICIVFTKLDSDQIVSPYRAPRDGRQVRGQLRALELLLEHVEEGGHELGAVIVVHAGHLKANSLIFARFSKRIPLPGGG